MPKPKPKLESLSVHELKQCVLLSSSYLNVDIVHSRGRCSQLSVSAFSRRVRIDRSLSRYYQILWDQLPFVRKGEGGRGAGG